ncbi:MAG: HAMP domain-containing histidine kinase [Alphaproteobacteria bacterium]|nr:HAMP domain-containing histidine kinase [Alphaproteobacteria bacterium]
MSIPRLFRTASFRFAVLFAGLLALSALLLLAFAWRIAIEVIDREITETIDLEIDSLREHYRRAGLPRLAEILSERSGPGGERLGVYLLTDARGVRIAGNIARWPAGQHDGGWITFTVESPSDLEPGEPRQVRGRGFVLPQGLRLLVGREMVERGRFERLMGRTLIWSVALVLLLGLGLGYLFSRGMLRRVDAIVDTSARIAAGKLDERVPVSGSGDEFDHLAGQLNTMLSHIEALMTGMRLVTDSLAHDLRSPLTRLRGRLEQLQQEGIDGAAARDKLATALADIDSVLRTFTTLIRIAESEADAGRVALAHVDLGRIAGEVAELYEPTAEERGLAIATEILPGLAVSGHADLLAQAIANVIDNAIKYVPKGGAIKVTADRDGGTVRLIVADTGPGIPEADRNRVLHRFVRLDPSRHMEGAGLGLSLVAAVAKLHGAALLLEDHRPGLRVVLTFPPG